MEAATRQYHPSPDDTLNAVLYGVFCDFMDGDYEIIRTLLKAVGEINQRMAMGDDTIESLLQSLMRLREVLLGEYFLTFVPRLHLMHFAPGRDHPFHVIQQFR